MSLPISPRTTIRFNPRQAQLSDATSVLHDLNAQLDDAHQNPDDVDLVGRLIGQISAQQQVVDDLTTHLAEAGPGVTYILRPADFRAVAAIKADVIGEGVVMPSRGDFISAMRQAVVDGFVDADIDWLNDVDDLGGDALPSDLAAAWNDLWAAVRGTPPGAALTREISYGMDMSAYHTVRRLLVGIEDGPEFKMSGGCAADGVMASIAGDLGVISQRCQQLMALGDSAAKN